MAIHFDNQTSCILIQLVSVIDIIWFMWHVNGENRIQSMMPMKYFETQQAITEILKGKNVALKTDAWTSIAKVGYVTCTIHFIEPMTWTLHDFSLGKF